MPGSVASASSSRSKDRSIALDSSQMASRRVGESSEMRLQQRSSEGSPSVERVMESIEAVSTNISEELEAAEKHRGIDNTNEKPASYTNPDQKDMVLMMLVFLLELILFIALLIAAYFLRFQKDLFRPYYFPLISCSDPQYSYPYIEDPSDTNNKNVHINRVVYYCLVTLCPLFVIVVGELLYHFLSDEKARALHIKSFKITTMPRRTLRFSAVFLIGIFVTSIITDSLKLVSSRPRPHFLTVCEPDPKLCDNLPVSSEGICTGDNTAAILEARMSFPSFYCSCTMYVAVYMAIYLHAILDLNAIYTLRPMFVSACVILGFIAGYTRYQLYYVHWEDMIVGYMIGAGIAVYLAYFIAHNFKERNPKKIIIYHKVVPDLKIAMMKHYKYTHADYLKYGDDRPFTNLPKISICKTKPSAPQRTPPRTSKLSIPLVSEADRKLAMDDPELPRRDSEAHYDPLDPPDYSGDHRHSPC